MDEIPLSMILGYHSETTRVCRFSMAALFFSLLFSFAANSAFAQYKTRMAVDSAMKRYDHLILGMNADSIAQIYTQDGELGKMAKGRDSIRNFLQGFKNFRVLSQTSETNSISLEGDSALQKGTYRQTVIIPSKDTVTVKGNFTAFWIWNPVYGWQIRRMETQPLN